MSHTVRFSKILATNIDSITSYSKIREEIKFMYVCFFMYVCIPLFSRSFVRISLSRSFILFMFNNILLVVKCPMGLYYDTPSKTCKPYPIGFISTQEGSLQCEACPANSSTPVKGSKTCTGNSNLS